MRRILSHIIVVLSLVLVSCSKDPVAPVTSPVLELLGYSELKRTSIVLNARSGRDISGDVELGFIVGTDYELGNNARRFPVSVFAGTSFSLEITDLEIGCTYYYKAYISSGGKTKTSEVSDFTTPYHSAPLLSDVEAANGVISARIVDDGGSRPVRVGFCWSTDENPDIFSTTCEVKLDAAGTFSMRLTDIETPKDLYVRAYADNGFYGNQVAYSGNQVRYCREESIEIPDPVFREYLVFNFDQNKDGRISKAEAESINDIEVPDMEISSLQGVEQCKNIEILNCRGNSLMELDLSNNRKLKTLNCGYNKLTDLDLSMCPDLHYINCAYNLLQSINILNCNSIEDLVCSNNSLQELDLSGCRQIRSLVCDTNGPLTRIKGLEFCRGLDTLICHGNNLMELSLSNNIALEILYCHRCQLAELDVSNCSKLKELYCGLNHIQFLNISNCHQLEVIDCEYNRITELDVSGREHLKELSCQRNNIRTINLGGCVGLERLVLFENLIEDINISDCGKLGYLDCSYNSLRSLDITNCHSIVWLECHSNFLMNLDLSGSNAGYLDCSYNLIKSLKIDNCHNLEACHCGDNRIEDLDLSGCENLKTLTMNFNLNIQALDLTSNHKINSLSCRQCASLQYIYLPAGITPGIFLHDDGVNVIYR